MRAVVQRVSRASVTVDAEVVGSIGHGLLILLGVSRNDTEESARYCVNKILNLRIFEDGKDKMNLSVRDINGELLVVSQFTLYGDTRRRRRPSFINAAPPEDAKRLYEYFVAESAKQARRIATGRFQTKMDVESVNNGPVTVLIDTEKTF